MATIKKQLKGDNLCNTSCAEKKNIIHPENCVEDVLMSSEGDTTLRNWIMGGLPTTNNTEPVMPNTLMEWLSIYYSDEHIGLPIASSNNIGGIKIGNTLSINNNSGVTNVNLNKIIATADDLGVIKVGNGLSINNEGILSLNSLPTASDRILGCININNTIEGLNLDNINAQNIDNIKYVPLNSIDNFTFEAVYAVPVNIVKTSTLSRDDSRAFISLPVNLFEYNNIRNAPSLASIEYTTNKVTSFSNTPSNTKYPSEKLLYDQLLLKADKDELTVNTSSGVTTINLKGTGGSATQTTVYTPVMVNELLGRAVGEAVIATFKIHDDGTYNFCYSGAESELQLIVIDGKGYLSAQGISATASDSLSVIYVFKNARIIPDATFKDLNGVDSAELLSLHIPSFVHEIGSGTCAGCTGLKSIDCEAMTPPTVSADSFDGITMANVELTIHNIVKDDYDNNGTHWAGVGTISTY